MTNAINAQIDRTWDSVPDCIISLGLVFLVMCPLIVAAFITLPIWVLPYIIYRRIKSND